MKPSTNTCPVCGNQTKIIVCDICGDDFCIDCYKKHKQEEKALLTSY